MEVYVSVRIINNKWHTGHKPAINKSK